MATIRIPKLKGYSLDKRAEHISNSLNLSAATSFIGLFTFLSLAAAPSRASSIITKISSTNECKKVNLGDMINKNKKKDNASDVTVK